jgi:hypothetical protein
MNKLQLNHTPASQIGKSYRQKNQQEKFRTKQCYRSIDLTDIYRIVNPTAQEYTFSSAAHGTFSKTECILGHKASLNKYKKIETISYILPDHNGIKLEINSKK